jgi:hypothetical protein
VTTAEIAASLPKAAAKVKSWCNDTAPATFSAITHGRYFESRFDAAHGYRYLLLLLPYPPEGVSAEDRRHQAQAMRRAGLEFICGGPLA